MHDILSALEAHGIALQPGAPPLTVGGGQSAAWRIETANGPLFLKVSPADSYPMFAAEARGLLQLAEANAIRVPAVVTCFRNERLALIALEWLDLGASGEALDAALGRQLADLHKVRADRFGWDIDNTIGRTPQINTWSDDWVEFFAVKRLKFQLDLVMQSGIADTLAEEGYRLLDSIEALFDGHRPIPSMLHGDLWSGNRAGFDGEPVIFDPATHFGDRECDLALARLFGGFHESFFAAYREAWPLPAGHQRRTALYQLYHVLNHVNLFGASYVRQAQDLLRTLLST